MSTAVTSANADPRAALRTTPLDTRRLRRAKAAYTTRFVAEATASRPESFALLDDPAARPQPGDVVLARVTEVGQHQRIELPGGRRARLYVGDEVLVAYGNRYAPDQFEAEVPATLGPVQLVAAGGVAGRVLSAHDGMLEATQLSPVGLLCDDDGPVNLRRYAPHRVGAGGADLVERATPGPTTLAVLGTSMNAGKSTTLGALVRGLTDAGLEVVTGKVTGTGAGGDPGLYADNGAARVLDFTDFGYASTYRTSPAEVRALLTGLHAELASTDADVILLEIGDGLFQGETAELLAHPTFAAYVDTVLFAAGDALGATAGVARLEEAGLPVCAVSGVLTAAPLAARELRRVLHLPVLDLDDLHDPETVTALLPTRRHHGEDRVD